MSGKERLDRLLQRRGLAATCREAAALIGAGRVLVDDQPASKAGSRYPETCSIRLRPRPRFVSRAGDKLQGALDVFGLDVTGRICLDVGCSTGGFTDCLLQRGAAGVYSVDVGYGVLDWKLRRDERVVVLERTNARYLTTAQIPEPVELVVIDVAFISLRTVLKPLPPLLADPFTIVALVKPQFELPRHKIPRGGVVREEKLHRLALDLVRDGCTAMGMRVRGETPSPVLGTKGNQEFFLLLESA